MSESAYKSQQRKDRHLSAKELARVAREATASPDGAHLGNRKLRRLEKVNGDSPTMKAVILIGGFFLVLESLHIFSVYVRLQRAFEIFLIDYWYPIVDFFTF